MRKVTSAVILATFFLSGCLTPLVWNKGLHPRTAEGETVFKTEDQSLAIEARVTGFKGSYTRYFVKEGKSLEAWLRANPASHKYSPLIVPVFVGDPRTNSWQEYPSETVMRDATITDLPVKFAANFSICNFNDPIAINVEGETEQVKLGAFIGLKKDRDPKTYPVLALLVPAAIVDVAIGVVMTPVVIFSFIYEGIAEHNREPAREKK